VFGCLKGGGGGVDGVGGWGSTGGFWVGMGWCFRGDGGCGRESGGGGGGFVVMFGAGGGRLGKEAEGWDDAVAMANQAVDGLCVLQRGGHCEGHRGPGAKMGLCVVSLLTSGGK